MIDSGVELAAARCAIGLLGIATRITLRCRPKYNIQEHAAAHESLPAVLEHEADYPLPPLLTRLSSNAIGIHPSD